MARLTKLLDLVTGLARSRSTRSSPEGTRGSTRRRPPARLRRAQPSSSPPATPSSLRRADGIELAYEPRDDGDADPGEVVWSWVPFEEDPSRGKDRPVVIVGHWHDDLCGVPLTTKARPGDPDRVLVGRGSWDRDGRPSYACLDRLLRVRAADVRREGAALDRERFTALVDALRARS